MAAAGPAGVEAVSSEKRRQKVIHDGYIYVFQKRLANDIRSFECEMRRKGLCKAKIKLNLLDQVVDSLNEHTHERSQTKIEVTKIKSQIQHSADNTNLPTALVLAGQVGYASPAAAANLPKIENLKRNIRRARQHMIIREIQLIGQLFLCCQTSTCKLPMDKDFCYTTPVLGIQIVSSCFQLMKP